MSLVLTFPDTIVLLRAYEMLSAKFGSPKCLNIMTDDTRIADGLTTFCPAISKPAWRQPYENNKWFFPTEVPADKPTPPVIPATTFYTIEP